MQRQVWWLIAVTTLLRLAFAASTGLGVDESYMVSAGRALSLGYFDHPPAAWWLSWGAAHLFGSEAPIVVRLPFIALFAVSTWLMVRLGAAVFDERSGFWAAVLLNLSPVFGVTSGTWVLPDGPLDCALLGAAVCLMRAIASGPPVIPGLVPGIYSTTPAAIGPREHGDDAGGGDDAWSGHGTAAIRSPSARSPTLIWWGGAGLCAGLALFSKYSAILTIGGAFLFLISNRTRRSVFASLGPYVAVLCALLVFSPVIIWNATHSWASFAFQGERAVGLRFHPVMPITTLLGEGLFVLPWIWAPMLYLLARAFRPSTSNDRENLLAWLAIPPIAGFALISAWSTQRVLFHWAAPGYLMLFPLLGSEVAARMRIPLVRRTVIGTAALVVAAVAVIGLQTRFDWLGDRLALVMRKDPTIEGIDWVSLRSDLEQRGLLRPGTLVGVANWRDGGKIAYGLGPDIVVLCLNKDARQFGFANPPAAHLGQEMLLLSVGIDEKAAASFAAQFDRIEAMPAISIRHRGRILQSVAVFLGYRLRTAR